MARVKSYIAEGAERNSMPDYLRFLYIAKGSSAEVATQLLIVQRQYSEIGIIEAESSQVEIHKMLWSVIRMTRRKTMKNFSFHYFPLITKHHPLGEL